MLPIALRETHLAAFARTRDALTSTDAIAETIQPTCVLRHGHRLERAVAIARHPQLDIADLVLTVLGVEPLREFPEPRPAGS